MATGFPVKANYATGDVLTAANMNDLSATLNLIAPTAKGDLFSGSAANTYAKLAVGADGAVLTADAASSGGVKWATASSGGMTLISTTTLSGSSVTLSSIPQTYTDLQLVVVTFTPSASARLRIAPNANTSSSDNVIIEYAGGGTPTTQGYQGYIRSYNTQNTGGSGDYVWTFPLYTNSANRKSARYSAGFLDGGGGNRTEGGFIKYEVGAITSLVLSPDTGTFSGGTAYLYGVK